MSDAIDCGEVYPRNGKYYEGLEQYKDANTNVYLLDDPKLPEFRPSEVLIQKDMKHDDDDDDDEEETPDAEDEEVKPLVMVLAAEYRRSFNIGHGQAAISRRGKSNNEIASGKELS